MSKFIKYHPFPPENVIQAPGREFNLNEAYLKGIENQKLFWHLLKIESDIHITDENSDTNEI